MADRRREIQAHHIRHPRYISQGIKSPIPEKSPSTSQVIVFITVFPIGGFLLILAGITLTITIVGLALTTPLFVIFSPVLVPAAFVIGMVLMGFLVSGVFGLTAVSSLSWIFNYLSGTVTRTDIPRQPEYAKGLSHVGQRTRDVGQAI